MDVHGAPLIEHFQVRDATGLSTTTLACPDVKLHDTAARVALASTITLDREVSRRQLCRSRGNR
jgi:hypothetical protein